MYENPLFVPNKKIHQLFFRSLDREELNLYFQIPQSIA